MTPVTSSSLVPTSTSNESQTRSVELHARSRYAVQRVSHTFRRTPRSFQIHNPRVSHSCRRASRSFQIRNSWSRSTEDKRPPQQGSEEKNSTALRYHVCRVSALRPARNFRSRSNQTMGCVHILRQCTTMTENKCCANMACGWCVAPTYEQKLNTRKKTTKHTNQKKKNTHKPKKDTHQSKKKKDTHEPRKKHT